MARIIGLDIGEKRIGVAVSDETKTVASGLEVISAASVAAAIEKIEGIVKGYNAEAVVVGLPLNMNGSMGPSADKVLRLCEKMRQTLSVDVSTFDERLTTSQGEKIMLQADMSRRKRRLKIDKLAAQIMLQAYLDSRKD